jgi:hypothetical protein
MPDKFGALIQWLKQPPTLKGLVILAGIAGVKLDPEQVQTITLAASGLYAALAIFYDNSSRAPKIPTAEDLNKLLTSEDIVALVKLRKAKIAAEKTLAEK